MLNKMSVNKRADFSKRPSADTCILHTNLHFAAHCYLPVFYHIHKKKQSFSLCPAEFKLFLSWNPLTAEEHAAFAQCLRLSQKLDDMERLQLYFREHTDAVAYLKKSKQCDMDGTEYPVPFYFYEKIPEALKL